MNWLWVWAAVSVALIAVAACCLRVSAWHRQEAAYWHDVAWRVRIDPKLDEVYRPILTHAQATRPSLFERARGWTPPVLRLHRPKDCALCRDRLDRYVDQYVRIIGATDLAAQPGDGGDAAAGEA